MKIMTILTIFISTITFARNEVDHGSLSEKCPNGYIYKLTEVNNNNDTTTFQCVSDSGKVHPSVKFKIANWKSGDYLREQTIGKIVTSLRYNSSGLVKSVTQSVNGVGFSHKCDFEYKKGSLLPAKDSKCKGLQEEYRGVSKSIKYQSFCSPSPNESTCTTKDGRVFRPSSKEKGILRYFYEQGHVVDEVEVKPGSATGSKR